MLRLIFQILFLAGLLIASPLLKGQGLPSALLDKYQDALDEGTHFEVGIYDNGQLQHLAYSNRDGRLKKVNANPNKLFEIGSFTKVLTAYTVHSVLRDEPEIHLQTQLKDLNLSFPLHPKNETQIIHLLNHTSLLPKMPASYVQGMLKFPKNPYLIYTKEKVQNYYKKHKSNSKLGQKYGYSNMGYGILGLLISESEGKDYPTVFNEKMRKELYLENTMMGISPKDYPRLFKSTESWDCLWNFGEIGAAGGAYSNVKDILSFTELVIQKDSKERVNQILSTMEIETLSLSEVKKIGQGWMIFEDNGHRIFYHEGGSRGYKSFTAIDTYKKRSVVFLSQNCGLNKNNGLFKQMGFELLLGLHREK